MHWSRSVPNGGIIYRPGQPSQLSPASKEHLKNQYVDQIYAKALQLLCPIPLQASFRISYSLTIVRRKASMYTFELSFPPVISTCSLLSHLDFVTFFENKIPTSLAVEII